MKTVDRYILRELFEQWLLGMGWFFTLVYFASALGMLMRFAVKNDIPLLSPEMLRLMVNSIPSVLVMATPMAALYGSLMAFARFSNDGEISALLTSGISFFRLVRPAALFGALMCGGVFLVNEFMMPPAERTNDRLRSQLARKTLEETEGDLVLRFPPQGQGRLRYIVKAQQFDPDSGEFIQPDVFVYGKDGVGLQSVVRAQRGRYNGGDDWSFVQCRVNTLTGRVRIETAQEKIVYTLGRTPEDITGMVMLSDVEIMSFRELRRLVQQQGAHNAPPRERAKATVAMHSRLALPLSCVLLCLIGPPLAMRPQRTTFSLGMGLCILIVIVYYMVWQWASILGDSNSIPPAIAAWVADALTAVLGVALIWRAAR